MAATTPISPDPLVPIEEESSPDMDFAAHVRTFNAVVSTAKWFVAHLLLLLIALYFLVIAGQAVTGIFFLCCALALLVFATLRRSSIRADLAKGLAAGPTAPARDAIDRTPGLGDRT
ncbi:MAG TPA: aa3-type cytochrome c oxidase subunit IV [Devosia sp.]|nr:aa3-type cytochrome c oxidase subunit IV [Devosia sp.]